MSNVKYETYYTWQGWVVRIFANGKWHYLHSVYKGDYKFCTDFLFAKFYKNRRTAQNIINSIKGR